MKFILLTISIIVLSNCSKPKTVLICGDHVCINKAEANQYFQEKSLIFRTPYEQISPHLNQYSYNNMLLVIALVQQEQSDNHCFGQRPFRRDRHAAKPYRPWC